MSTQLVSNEGTIMVPIKRNGVWVFESREITSLVITPFTSFNEKDLADLIGQKHYLERCSENVNRSELHTPFNPKP